MRSHDDLLAVATAKGYITIYRGDEQVCYFCCHKSKVIEVGFSPDGQFAYSLGDDKKFTLCNLADQKTIKAL